MMYTDSVYGCIAIEEPVVLDLIRSPPMQRLKEIDQAGFLEPFRPQEEKITRFEHSIGVFALLKRFGAHIEEQVSGLIHDVSHTAFSHCADYLGSHESQQKQTHQDDVFESFVRRSEIPLILTQHGLTVSYILDDTNFPLKETQLPDLCADRIDYSLRTAIAAHVCSSAEVRSILDHLTSDGTRWIFQSHDAALRYASLFSYLNTNCYSGITSAVMFHTVGSVLQHALEREYISYNDLYGTDKQVLHAIMKHAAADETLFALLETPVAD